MTSTDERSASRAGERVGAKATLAMLFRELGAFSAARVLVKVVVARARREPFRDLPPPRDRRDELSRAQAGPLIVLYRAARDVAGQDFALRLAREAAHRGGVVFLDRMLPSLEPAEFLRGGERALRELADKFFNATGVAHVDSGVAAFDVHACRFVELTTAAGTPELAPMFCEVDRAFFDAGRRPVVLKRLKTLAHGDDSCDFRFSAR